METTISGAKGRARNTFTGNIRRLAQAIGLVLILGMPGAAPVAAVTTQTTPEATPYAAPQASPVSGGDGCAGLADYFQSLASLTLENEGLVLMREAGFDALILTGDEAATVVASLSDLIPELEALHPPAPAIPYHGAYLEVMAWYRDLAAFRDEASHQRLINNDRRLFGLMGLAIQTGQSQCGYEAWNKARDAAFPPEG